MLETMMSLTLEECLRLSSSRDIEVVVMRQKSFEDYFIDGKKASRLRET